MGEFAKNLKKLRNEKNISQRELAEIVGVTQVAISQYEKGESVPRINIAMKLAESLDTTCEKLCGKEVT
jgi:transcriptional regulator with XRE-family HTH domain